MSAWGNDWVKPSQWAIERFGQQAGKLAAAIPMQLARAHARAHLRGQLEHAYVDTGGGPECTGRHLHNRNPADAHAY